MHALELHEIWQNTNLAANFGIGSTHSTVRFLKILLDILNDIIGHQKSSDNQKKNMEGKVS